MWWIASDGHFEKVKSIEQLSTRLHNYDGRLISSRQFTMEHVSRRNDGKISWTRKTGMWNAKFFSVHLRRKIKQIGGINKGLILSNLVEVAWRLSSWRKGAWPRLLGWMQNKSLKKWVQEESWQSDILRNRLRKKSLQNGTVLIRNF